jgi:hypothetical protein
VSFFRGLNIDVSLGKILSFFGAWTIAIVVCYRDNPLFAEATPQIRLHSDGIKLSGPLEASTR